MFLGFVLAVISVRGSQKGTTAVAILVPLLVLGLPLMDTGFSVLRRTLRIGTKGMRTDNALRYVAANYQRVFMPDRGHIHHRLLDIGFSHRNAVLVLYGAGTLFALAAFALVLIKSLWLGLLLAGALTAGMAGFVVLLYFRVRRARRSEPAEIAGKRRREAVEGPALTPRGSQLQGRRVYKT